MSIIKDISGPWPGTVDTHPIMAQKKNGSGSTKSSSKSIKSLALKASATIQNIKRKAIDVLSPGKKKKAKHIPKDNSGDSQSSSDTPSQVSDVSSIVEILDRDNSDDQLSEY